MLIRKFIGRERQTQIDRASSISSRADQSLKSQPAADATRRAAVPIAALPVLNFFNMRTVDLDQGASASTGVDRQTHR